VPVAVKFLLGFGKGFAVPMISVDKYVSFVTVLTFVFGLAFELPIAILLFSKAGIVTPQYLSANRRYAVVIIFIVAAIFTPPDVVSQCLLAVPLLALYELSIILTRLLSR
jgi:sec-independent protein translocase protein TatC